MATIETSPAATGGPGIEPRWTRSSKDAVGTAYSTSSNVWFTLSLGILNEVYHPTIDTPQIRDLEFLVTDGETFFHDERRHLHTTLEYIAPDALGFSVTNADPEGRYRLVKEIISDPHNNCVLIRTRLEGYTSFIRKLHLYVLLAPHLDVGGWGNTGNLTRIEGREFLTAHRNGMYLALAATVPFLRSSCGYVGTTDGWHDLSNNLKMDYEFASASDGNIALTAEFDLSRGYEFTVGLAFGRGLNRAVATLFQSLGVPFVEHRQRFIEQWNRAGRNLYPLENASGDGGALYRKSHSLLLAHEDKRYPGAMIASLSIPWGESKSDDDLGGYHLVWTRDLVNSVTGLLASGDHATPHRALIYLSCSQQADGGFPQNFWIDGRPYWKGIQLDEVAFPIMLAWRLAQAGALKDFDPYPMVLAAAGYLIEHGPATPQERWEENSGFSPSTLASNIAGLTCASAFARKRGDEGTASYIQDYADFLESHVETWTVTNQGTLLPGINRYYLRINPIDISDPAADENPDTKILQIRNREPDEPFEFPAKDVVDAGFLELVRYGIRKPGDPLIEDSLKVVDAVLKRDFTGGPCWRRYNHDGYGQRKDGGPFTGSGQGHAWPLLTGERGHYELAAGREVKPYVRAMESFANASSLLPEQIWDGPDRPERMMYYGHPTGAAMPLMWAHAEYIKLLRSVADGAVFDLLPEVARRYRIPHKFNPVEYWKPDRRIGTIAPGETLRIQARNSFRLHWSTDEWKQVKETAARTNALKLHYADVPIAKDQKSPVRFTFFWVADGKWEGRDYQVEIKAPAL
jgi:glucoamylase